MIVFRPLYSVFIRAITSGGRENRLERIVAVASLLGMQSQISTPSTRGRCTARATQTSHRTGAAECQPSPCVRAQNRAHPSGHHQDDSVPETSNRESRAESNQAQPQRSASDTSRLNAVKIDQPVRSCNRWEDRSRPAPQRCCMLGIRLPARGSPRWVWASRVWASRVRFGH